MRMPLCGPEAGQFFKDPPGLKKSSYLEHAATFQRAPLEQRIGHVRAQTRKPSQLRSWCMPGRALLMLRSSHFGCRQMGMQWLIHPETGSCRRAIDARTRFRAPRPPSPAWAPATWNCWRPYDGNRTARPLTTQIEQPKNTRCLGWSDPLQKHSALADV